ncbi:amidase signature enzyme [Pleomassaria siparia CBS 279.74]|uniref:Amidase signature enzyme n=1 Tax=Pleomassaria siparia CBS 279.74 TaxID=1314801 RepID=A0A6G1JV85_9PLEO|nr:amidase signature enzyme [Pleomassaria siparia CBS 279.74]
MIPTARAWTAHGLRRTIPFRRLEAHSPSASPQHIKSAARIVLRPHITKAQLPTPEQAKVIPTPTTWLWLEPVTRPFRAYGRVQQRRPYMTQFVSALVIYFVGDVVAQKIGTGVDKPSTAVLGTVGERGEEEAEEIGWVQAWAEDRDWHRTGRALFIGGLAAIPGYRWFLWLGNNFNYRSKVLSLTTKVLINQSIFTPLFNTYFFGLHSLLSGSSFSETATRIQNTVPTSVVNSCKIWPAVTAFMFAFVPVQYRNIFGGTIAIGWQAYLSLLNQRAAKKELSAEGDSEMIREPINVSVNIGQRVHEGQRENTGPPTVTAEKLQSIAHSYGVAIPEREQPHYLQLLNGLDATLAQLSTLPIYTDPRLHPDPSTLPRTYTKLGGEPDKNPLNTWSHQTSITSAKPVDERLKGRTVVVKDNVAIAGLPLTGGTFPELLAGKKEFPIPEIDAVVVRRALESGAVVRGGTNCEHFSMSPISFTSATGPVHNAWLKGYTTGGSSSGCAAIVATTQVRTWRKRHNLPLNDADLGEGVDMAIGGDQGGSIRIPASYAGIYGLKPTHGLVPYTGIISLIPMIDHTGPMTANLEDNALLLSVLAGYDGMDPRCTPETPLRRNTLDYSALLTTWKAEKKERGEWTPQAAGRGLRVGIVKESLQVMGLTEEVKAIIQAAAAQFKAVGADVQEISIPMHTLGPSIWTIATRPFMVDIGLENRVTPYPQYPMPEVTPPPFSQSAFDTLNKHNPAVVNMFFNSAFLNEKPDANQVLAKSMTHVQQLRDAYDMALEDFDVLLTPVNPRTRRWSRRLERH